MTDDPIVAASRRDLLDDIIAADAVAADERKQRERRVFGVACAAVVVLAVSTGTFAGIAWKSIDNNAGQRTAAARRIDKLTTSNENLADQVESQSGEIGGLRAQVEALTAQVEQLGGEPVVIVTPSGSTTTTSTTSTTRPPDTTTTTQPPDDGICAGPICIGGRPWR